MGFEAEMGVVLPASIDHIDKAIDAVRAEKVIAVPTDTLYGFACDAWYVVHMNYGYNWFNYS